MPPARSGSFKQFIQHLAERGTSGEGEYWASELENVSVTDYPELPTPYYVAKATRTSKVSMSIDFRRVLQLMSGKVTVSTVIRAAWAIVLARHSNSNDVSFGVVLSGRNVPLEGIEEIAGPTLVTVPVRIRVGDTCVLAELLSTIQEQAVHMIPFEHTGIHNIQKISTSTRNACSFRTLLVVQPEENSSEDEFLHELNHLGGMQRSSPLTIDCQLGRGVITLYAHFDDTVISQRDVDWVLVHMRESLHALTSGDGIETVHDVRISGDEDLHQIREWNGDCPQKVDRCLHDLFERKVAENPLEIAIYDQTTTTGISYGELDFMSTCLAHRLQDLQVVPETMVPICFEGSSMAIVAIIAVLKAGGAYVPLDISHPESQLKSIIREVDAKFVLCSASCAQRLDVILAQVIVVDASSMINFTSFPERRLARKVQPINAASVIYTSGNTGAPKAVVLTHAAISTSASHLAKFYGIRKNTRVLQYNSFAFDMSLKEIFITLLHGGCICIPTAYNKLENLSKAAGDMAVDVAFLTPTVAGLMKPRECPNLKTLCFGGEFLTHHVANIWAGRVEIFNSYGSAETCMNVSATLRSPTLISNLGNIGCGVTGLLWIITLDEPRRLAPVGCPGEIAISGHTLARGYLNGAEKTIAAFIETPAWAMDSGIPTRCYLTGDAGRYNSDGSVQYLGKLGRQVRLGGLRIELGEIEHHLQVQNDQISQAVAELVVIGQHNDSPTLVVFVRIGPSQLAHEPVPLELLTSTDEFRIVEADARNRLRDVVPPYMVPAFFVPVSHIPMTISGKIDRKKLIQVAAKLDRRELKVSSHPAGGTTSGLLPRGGTERVMCELWKEVLSIGSQTLLTTSDNFFHLGGDSIATIRLVAAARKIGLSISGSQVYQTPRLGEMASCAKFTDNTRTLKLAPFALAGGMELEELASLCKISVASIGDVYPCTALQEGLMALSTRNGAYVAQRVYVLSDVDESQFRTAWERSVNRNPILRTRIVHSAKYGSLQVVCKDIPNNLWHTGEDLERYLRKDREDLITPGSRLCRFALVQKGGSTCYFVLTLHHAVSINTYEC